MGLDVLGDKGHRRHENGRQFFAIITCVPAAQELARFELGTIFNVKGGSCLLFSVFNLFILEWQEPQRVFFTHPPNVFVA